MGDKQYSSQTITSYMYLSSEVEELIDEDFYLVEEDGIDVRVQFMSNQLFHVLLYLRTELLIVAHKELQQMSDKSEK